MRAPATTSLCPPIYLVILCMTTSAPSKSGFWRHGDMKVLSITSIAPFAWQSFATAAMSVHFIVGLVGDSIQTILVFFLIDYSTNLRLFISIMSHLMPVCGSKIFLMYL